MHIEKCTFMAAGMARSGFVGNKGAHTHTHTHTPSKHIHAFVLTQTQRQTGGGVNATLSRWDIPRAVIGNTHFIISCCTHTHTDTHTHTHTQDRAVHFDHRPGET